MKKKLLDTHYSFGFGLCWRLTKTFGFIEVRFGHNDYRIYIYSKPRGGKQ